MKRVTMLSVAALLTLLSFAMVGPAQTQSNSDSRITAGIIVTELRAMGYTANIDQDPSGDPRVSTMVDGYKWQVYFYNCSSGPLADRKCESFQFFVDNELPNPYSQARINQWNKEYRYAKAYLQQNNEAGCPASAHCFARIEVDVMMAGTGADPAQTFRAYIAITKSRAIDFRKFIGAT